jgi:hypothetical protein
MNIFDNFKKLNPFKNNNQITDIQNQYTGTETITNYVGDLLNAAWDGGKYPGSMGPIKDYSFVDYWTLRKRSTQLFKSNNYARGAIRRLLRNTIHTGLNLEANPISEVLGITEENAIKWAENTEIDFNLWAKDPQQCDFYKEKTWGLH